MTAFVFWPTLASGQPGSPAVQQPPAKLEPAKADEDKFKEIAIQCDDRIKAMADLSKGLSEGQKALADIMAKIAAGAGKAPAVSTDPLPVQRSGPVQPPAPAVAEVARQVQRAVDGIALNVALATKLREQAATQLALAKAAKDPTVGMVYYKEALRYVDQGERLNSRARADLAIVSGHSPLQSNIDVHSDTLEGLKVLSADIDKIKAQGPGSLDGDLTRLNKAFDGLPARSNATAAGGNTNFFNAAPRAYGNGIVTLGNGTRIDVSAIERAAAASRPGDAGQTRARPLFRSVPTRNGGQTIVVDPEVHSRARNTAPGPQVGGVALDVTFVALEAAGVPGFRGGLELQAVNKAVLISLQGLAERLKPYAGDQQRWANLPDELRYPGGAGRIVGYLLDRTRQDVVLIAEPSTTPKARLDVDSIILGLRASWKDGVAPFVSLDPTPVDPYGPQMSRVGGVPADSIVAKVMLEADYAMKQILGGVKPTDSREFRTLVQLIQQNPGRVFAVDGSGSPGTLNSRFWFHPLPLGPGSVAITSDGRLVMFDARLHVMTEKMTLEGASLVGTGDTDDVSERAANGFSRAFESLANSERVDPEALFHRLRALSSVVTTGVLLRRTKVDYPTLMQAADLPYRQLGKEAAPKQYASIVVKFDAGKINGEAIEGEIGGGVDLAAYPRRSSIDAPFESATAALERLVDGGEVRRRAFMTVAIDLTLSHSTRSETQRRVDGLLLAGAAAFTAGKLALASEHYSKAIDIDPASVEAYLNLAFALDRLGHREEAAEAIYKARVLDPDDPAARLIEFAIRVRSDRTAFRMPDAKKMLAELTRTYTVNARRALLRRDREQAYKWANDAIALWFDAPPEAYVIRGFATLEHVSGRSCDDFSRASEETQSVLHAAPGAADRNNELTFALANYGLANCALLHMARPLFGWIPVTPPTRQEVAASATAAIERLAPVKKLFPDMTFPYTTELALEVTRYKALQEDYDTRQLAAARKTLVDDANAIVERFPKVADSHFILGLVYFETDRPEQAIAAWSRALEIDAKHVGSLNARAIAFAGQKKCQLALADMKRALASPLVRGVPPEFTARCGRP